MRTTTISETASRRTPTSGFAGLVRMQVHRPRRGPTMSSRHAGHRTDPRIWREVAPGVWRPIYIPDQAARRAGRAA